MTVTEVAEAVSRRCEVAEVCFSRCRSVGLTLAEVPEVPVCGLCLLRCAKIAKPICTLSCGRKAICKRLLLLPLDAIHGRGTRYYRRRYSTVVIREIVWCTLAAIFWELKGTTDTVW